MRGIQLGFLTATFIERGLLAGKIEALAHAEELYQHRLQPRHDVGTVGVYLGLTLMRDATGDLIDDLDAEIARIELIPSFLRHNIKDIKSDLEYERNYFIQTNEGLGLVDEAQATLAGGSGYNYLSLIHISEPTRPY